MGDRAGTENGPGSSSVKSYLNLLHREISLAPKVASLSTVYIGGGTPSILSADQVANLLDHLRLHFGFQNGAEISFEVDPASFDTFSLEGFLDAGVNRLSLGAQSFDDKVLAQLGRRHTANDLLDACGWINQAFNERKLFSWSLDLIQNLPGQDLCSWEKQLLKALDISPPHMSIYDLSIEKGTVFEWRQNRGELSLPNEDDASDMSKMTSDKLKQAGFSRYEISNYALPGHASRHNRVYWSGSGWWGFGQGATSCPWGVRSSRPRTREKYKKWLEVQENDGLDKSLTLNNEGQLIPLDELLIFGLRRREGIDFKELVSSFNWDESQLEINLNNLKNYWANSLKEGLIKQRGYRFYLTDPHGMDLSNQILVDMLLWYESLLNSSIDQPNL
ncbi:Oxygen independent coproporphyrinogen III oxidase [Prochlorococcus sp. SS52]|nr:Oxygen independent coproporphyrinogen III oxidase [Prochlorococcus marinus str. LG]KGG22117.1 Oxygen independent coproporphyrinogen III oxidase [Prochlorococcus marinus str. SS2]KGG24566.1 Oxygen independent coproporphyrinogen III oxidase [Prochlorococcus marinus str. SS35]KGG33460.1 Oxygen independent coproporphyrinogen III oxidase [Prochlorococcus marinus str. SS51]KGG37377.1 Oxygen independent coproporphyrinogen III oxidase [Prochlorococcus sp. SS52]